MELFIIILVVLIIFDLLALKWGVDSTDGIDSPEWKRRQSWYGPINNDTNSNRETIPTNRASLNGHAK